MAATTKDDRIHAIEGLIKCQEINVIKKNLGEVRLESWALRADQTREL